MKVKIITLLLLSCSYLVSAQVKKWTLRECVEYAIENNISIQQSELDLENAEIDKSDAVGNFLPSVNGSASHSWNVGLNQDITTGVLRTATTQFTSGRVSVGVDIFKGLQNQNRLRRSKLNILANQYQMDDMRDDISLAVANGYLQILFNRENLVVQKAQYAVTEQDLKRTQELVESGVLPKGDLLEIEATAATQEQRIINAENALRLSKISLAQLLLLDDYENFDVADEDYMIPKSTITEITPEEIYQKSLTFRGDVKLSMANVEIAEMDLKIAKGTMMPTLTGFYGYDTRVSHQDRSVATGQTTQTQIGTVQSTGDAVVTQTPVFGVAGPLPFVDQLWMNDGQSFGVSLNVPIFNGFAARNNVKRSEVNVRRNELMLKQTKLDLENTINQVWNDAQSAFKTFEASSKTIEARELAYEYAKERFDVGLMNSFDFSQAQARLDNAQAELIRAKYDYIFKLKVLEYYFGIPVEEL
ncbi:TolC family protein [Zhouia amylolytica]|uniref:TolC family protein n=1 Tax=Zhouia amylolytica TaxID=376730 RepID=UPI0020CFB6E0|nr:TolC family protein [Zhouia amylolytica]MCQ0110404.1 TolC family protein [Zhouia amylolytica]